MNDVQEVFITTCIVDILPNEPAVLSGTTTKPDLTFRHRASSI